MSRRPWLRPFVLALVAVIAGMSMLWALQRRLMYFPFGAVPEPAAVGLRASIVQFETSDGLTLGGWLVPPAGTSRGVTIVVFNGNAGNRSFRAPLAERFADAGYKTLLFDYRGFGGNPGTPTEQGLLRDARAAITWLTSQGGADPERLVYFGESLGTGVAVAMAAERQPAALVLRSPFTSMVDVARHHYPFLPVGLLLRDRYQALDLIGGIRCPVLVIAGDRDRIVPARLSQRLFAAAREPKQLLLLEGLDHNDEPLAAGREMVAAVDDFLRRFVPEPVRSAPPLPPAR
ncbi:MAG TPA: alpha/beta hydrolase [Vicinamibacterales bacterium]